MAEKDATVRLRRAVQENNLFLVKRLIKRTGDMRNPDPSNKHYTSLAWAAILGNEETFEYLLSEGHDEEEYSRDSDESTILILLAEAKPPLTGAYNSRPSDQEFQGAILRMARMYFERYPETLDWANSDGKTALQVASLRGNEELVRMLCDLGADLDLADNEGNTPLHYASAWGHIPVVQLLIERNCGYNVRNNDGFTPSDYAYSTSTRDVLQDTARAVFESNKQARRNVFAQAAARGNEWGAMNGQPIPILPKLANGSISRVNNGSVRMRSGSGTSRTTATSDSGDWDNYSTPGHSRNVTMSLASSLSPPRHGTPLPPIQQSSAQPIPSSSASAFTVPSPTPQAHATLAPITTMPTGLSPIASRMRERDAEAMEKYKLRQRSGSAATTSTDTPSQDGSGISSGGPSEDDLASLHSLATIGSVAPRRRLRPSASAAQLRAPPQPISSNQPSQQDNRNRSGTSPGILKRHPSLSSASPTTASTDSTIPTPTQAIATRPGLIRPSLSRESGKDKEFIGPSTDFAKFPPPPASQPQPQPQPQVQEPAERSQPPVVTHTRRLPFNLLSSHKHNSDRDHHLHFGHKRNSSANSLASRIT